MEPENNNNKPYTLADYLADNPELTLSFFYSYGHDGTALPEFERVGIKFPNRDAIVSSVEKFYKELKQGSINVSGKNHLQFIVPSGLVDIVLSPRKRELVISAKHINAPY